MTIVLPGLETLWALAIPAVEKKPDTTAPSIARQRPMLPLERRSPNTFHTFFMIVHNPFCQKQEIVEKVTAEHVHADVHSPA